MTSHQTARFFRATWNMPRGLIHLMVKLISVLLLATGLAAAGPAADAEQVAGVDLPEKMVVDEEPLYLNGAGLHEATVFNVDVFVAALYLAEPTASATRAVSSRQTKRLLLRFKRSVSRRDLVRAAKRAFGDRGGIGGTRWIGSRLDGFLGSLPDAEDGDELSFTHRPGRGLEVRHNGRVLTTVQDEEIARAFLGAWIGPEAASPKLERALLGRS